MSVPIPGIVDTHVHLWSRRVADSAWLRAAALESLRRPFTSDDFQQASSATSIGAAIAVVAYETLDETRWLMGETAHDPRFRGVVGWVDIQGEPAEQLDDLTTSQSTVPLVGIRVPATADSAVLVSDTLSRLLEELALRSLTFDLLVRANGLGDAVTCVRAHPETTFVLDHLGNPPAERAARRQWAAALVELSRSGNVRAKISGLTVEHRTPAAIQEVVDVALTAFGPDRLMLGSDWPVSTLATDFNTSIKSSLVALNLLSPAELQQILRTTAMHTYPGSSRRED